MNTQRKWLLVAGLFLVWAVVFFLQVTEGPEDDTVSVNTQDTLGTQGRNQTHSEQVLTLAETFDNPRQSVKFSTPRNIFNPLGFASSKPQTSVNQSASKPKKSPSSAPKPSVSRKPPAPPPGPSPGELAAQRARQQLNQYRFLGYLTKGGESQAFLSNGQAIYIVKQGEQVEGRIRVRKIDPTIVVLSMTVLETGADVEATIPLTKEQQG